MGLEKSELTAGPEGLVLYDAAIRRELRWADMTGVGTVKPFRGVETSFGGSSAGVGQAVAAGVNRAAQQLSGSLGLFGRGKIEADAGNALAQRILEQNRGIWGADEAGTPLVAISPSSVDDDWFDGRIGDRVRHYRPDLADEIARRRARRDASGESSS